MEFGAWLDERDLPQRPKFNIGWLRRKNLVHLGNMRLRRTGSSQSRCLIAARRFTPAAHYI
jgi:hypothetical protein